MTQGSGYDTGYLLVGRILWLANPLFYALSGYLFFHHGKVHDYPSKLRRRFHTYLIPYLAWNTIYLLFFLLATWSFPALMGEQGIRWNEITPGFLWKVYVCYYGEGLESTPLDGPLWFLRNLILITVLSPLLRYLLSLHRLSLLPLLCIPFLPIGTEAITTLTYYGLGAYIALWNIDFIDISRRFSLPCTILFIFLSVWLVLGNPPLRIGLDTLSVLCGMVMLTSFCSCVQFRFSTFYQTLFFIYASHGIIARLLTKVAASWLLAHSISPAWYGLIHVGNLFVTLAITYSLSCAVRRLAPRTSPWLGLQR